MRMVKWIRLYQNPNYKPPTPKQLESFKIREQKIMTELYEQISTKSLGIKNVFN